MKPARMSFSTSSFYNRFSFFYPLVDIFLKPQKRILFEEINKLPDGTLLEIGVGNGSHLKLYKKHAITGIDTSSAMLSIAEKQNHNNVQLLHMNGEALLFQDEQFDYVVLSHVIAVVENPEQVIEEAFRVLKPHGKIFILNHFTPNNWLKYVDLAFGKVSNLFHFKARFYINDIKAIKRFAILKEINLGPASYFKLLIYQKK